MLYKFMIKKLLSVAFAFVLGVMTVNAQIVKGDMNDDGRLTVADLSNTASRILENAPLEYVSPTINPYATDNSMIVGTWYSRRIKSITFGADGRFELNDSIRSDYSIQELADRGCRYEFMPNIGSVLVYDSLAEVVGAFDVLKVADSTLIMTLHGDKTYYTFSTSMPTGGDNVQDPVVIIPDNYWNSEKDILAMMSSMYLRYAQFMRWEKYMEDIALNEKTNPWDRITPTNDNIAQAWTAGYSTIYIANQLIDNLEKFPGELSDRRGYLAQAYCMRAIVHYMMAQLWGDIPYVVSVPTDDSNMNVPQSRYDIIVKDCYECLGKYYWMLHAFDEGNNFFSPYNTQPLMNEMALYLSDANFALLPSTNEMIVPAMDGEAEYIVIDNVYNQLLTYEMTSQISNAELAVTWKNAMPRYGAWAATKRLGAAKLLSGMSPVLLFPIPEREIQMNPYMKQNPGYSDDNPYIPPTPTVDSCVVKVELLPGGGMLESEFEEAKVTLKNVYTTVEMDAATGKYVPAGIGNITLTRVKDSDNMTGNTVITRADMGSGKYLFAANMVAQPVLADAQLTMEVSGNLYILNLSQVASIPSFEKDNTYKYTMTLSKVGISGVTLQVSSKNGGQTR